ncbi:MAG: hypothetical protein GXP31_13350 [Kiritimatiellaeota bacterium]|nr:hypothetical protein [Kiritimatiellota bacterium]
MAYDGVIDDVKKAIALEEPGCVPVFALSEEFDVKWYGKWDYEAVCRDGDKIAEVWIAAVEEFDYDWAWVQVDDCFEFEPLGVGCPGEGNILRATSDHLPCTRESLESWPVYDPLIAGRIPEKLKAIRKIRDRFGDTVLIQGAAAAPYSCVGLACGLAEAMILGVVDRALLDDMCAFFVEQQYRFIKAQVEAGAHAVWLGDCNAYSSMISVDQYRDLALPSCKELVERCKNDFDVIVHLHNSETQVPYLLAETETGADIISVGPDADIAAVKEALFGKCCFSGNLDPIEVLMRGTPEDVATETERILNTCKPGGGYLFNTGEMNPRDTPVENMHAMLRAAKRLAM